MVNEIYTNEKKNDGTYEKTKSIFPSANFCGIKIIEPWHGISNNVVCVTSKDSDQQSDQCIC